MKKTLILMALALVLLGSCAQIKTLITVNPDGSGFIDQEIALTGPAQEIVALMAQSDKYFMDETELQAYAAQLGEGVSYVSHESIADGNGVRVRFAFDDINAVRLEQDGPSDLISIEGMTSTDSEEKPPMTFVFERGSPASLVIQPALEMEEGAAKDSTSMAAEEEALQQIRVMLADARFVLAVDVAGTIQETDATYKDGARITLMDIDFNEFLRDDDLLRIVANTTGPTPELMAMMADHGFRIEMQESVRVVFE